MVTRSHTTDRLVAVLIVVGASTIARAHEREPRPLRGEPVLPAPAVLRAETRGIVVLAVPAPERVRIPGGRFTMGSSPIEMQLALFSCQREILRERCSDIQHLFRAEGLAHEVELSPYELDRMEVTVGAYLRCVSAGACAPPKFSLADARFARPNLPVTHVTWEDARSYCGFLSGRLPTEAEWEYAARGPEGRRYPWGNVYNAHVCNHGAFSTDPTDVSDGHAGLAPVGSYPDGQTPLGLHDMAGNAAEWVADFFDLDEKGFSYAGRTEIDPKGPATGSRHVIRGASYLEGAAWMRGAARTTTLLSYNAEIGFRCAYSLR